MTLKQHVFRLWANIHVSAFSCILWQSCKPLNFKWLRIKLTDLFPLCLYVPFSASTGVSTTMTLFFNQFGKPSCIPAYLILLATKTKRAICDVLVRMCHHSVTHWEHCFCPKQWEIPHPEFTHLDAIYLTHFLPLCFEEFHNDIYFLISDTLHLMLLSWVFASPSVVCSMTSRKAEKCLSKHFTVLLSLSSPLHTKLSIAALSRAPLPSFGDHQTHVKSCRITLAGLNGTSTFLCCTTFQLRIFSTSPFFTRNSSQLRIAASKRTRIENGRRAAWVRGKKQIQFLP